MAERALRLDPSVSIAVATKNEGKLRELIALWQAPPVLVAPGTEYVQPDEPFDTYEENAVVKARALAAALNAPALADDSGIEVEAMGWKPGVLSARTPTVESSWQERNANILEQVRAAGVGASRAARFVCACALVAPGFEPVVARGEVMGAISDRPRGGAGFGYDPIFFYPPLRATFAEIGDVRKNEVSHRGRAVRALQARLRDLALGC